MERAHWSFSYTTTEVQEAARKRAAYHRSREQHWKARLEEIRTGLPEMVSEVEVQKFLAAASSGMGGVANTYAPPRLQINPQIEKDFSHAAYRLTHHRGQAEEYERWASVLDREKATRSLELHYDDVEYFSLNDPTFARLIQQEA